MSNAAALYTKDILRLAMSLPIEQHLADNGDMIGRGEARSASCGSHVSVELRHDGNVIADAAMKVSSCALGQASAAILLKYLPGMNKQAIEHARRELAYGLSGEGAWPQHWLELAHLQPTQSYPARHSAILIPYDAALFALNEEK